LSRIWANAIISCSSRGEPMKRRLQPSWDGIEVKGDAQPNYSRLPIRHLLQRLIHAPAALAMLWPALLVLGGYVAWNRWGAEEIAKQFYGLDVNLIHVTQRPEHIASDITEVVYRDTKLDQLSLIDPSAAARIASAFSSHPWVSKVTAVRKLPGGQVEVHLQYRVPVAMVYVISRHPDMSGRPGFFAIDEQGVLLPTSEFTRERTMRYIHIEIPDVYPTGGVGSQFGDPKVVGAAKLAALIAPYREILGIRSIQVHETSRTSPVPQYQVVNHLGEGVLWGSAPGQEVYAETKADEKLAQLLKRSESSTTTVSHP
jgi:hypothetical protein